MQVTIFSFFMAMLWSSVIIVIQYFLLKKRYFIKMFGVLSVFLIFIFSVLRMLFPVEFPYTKSIVFRSFWNPFYNFLYIEKVNIVGRMFTRGDVLVLIWMAGALVLSVVFLAKYFGTLYKIGSLEIEHDNKIDMVLKKVTDTVGKKVNVRVLKTSAIGMPVGVGVWRKTIFLPEQKYSEEQLFDILLHEITHFLNRDIPLKILIQLICCIFWWNPVIYLLRKDLAQVLEIKCDLSVVENMDKQGRIHYLSTILYVIKTQRSYMMPYGFEFISIVGNSSEPDLVERFKIVSDEKENRSKSRIKLIWYLGFFCIILVSYSFVLQPEYTVPKEEIETDNSTFEITTENTFIVQEKNGDYLVIYKDKSKEIINKETAEEMVKDGFELKEGNKYEKR